jgi:c-di-GMP-binding flagellar brake protein YcgR
MKKEIYKGPERRQFVRLDYITPLAYKVCKKKTISKLLQGYTSNISAAGLLCNIKERVKKNDLLWLSFDKATLDICTDLDKRSLIYQNGVIGKVVRIKPKDNKTYDVGIQFITREEKNLTHIYPKIYFLKDKFKLETPQENLEPIENKEELEEQGEREYEIPPDEEF